MSKRHLPHWEQEGATYFVTFRTADSLPAESLCLLKQKREVWLRLHPRPWSPSDYAEYCRLAFERLDTWLDRMWGGCPLRRTPISQIVVDAMLHFDGIRYHLDRSVVMPNHVHSLFKPAGEWQMIQILQSWKSFTGLRINEALGVAGQFWFHESFDRIVRDWEELERFRDYIIHNPTNAGLSDGEFRLFQGIGLTR